MAWLLKSLWINVILIGIIGVFSLGLGLSPALAAMELGHADDLGFEAQLPTVTPELTSPAETPIAETAPQQISALDWWEDAVITAETVEPEEDILDTVVHQWLLAVQTLFENR